MKDGGEPVYVSSRFVGLEIWQHLAYWKEALYGTHLRLSIVGAVDKGTGTATGIDASMQVCEAAFFFFFYSILYSFFVTQSSRADEIKQEHALSRRPMQRRWRDLSPEEQEEQVRTEAFITFGQLGTFCTLNY